ncbi:MAG: hypothetical protein WC777_02295 [Candidatus Gracilibacteria bacterium]|jgi:hypothetical protein
MDATLPEVPQILDLDPLVCLYLDLPTHNNMSTKDVLTQAAARLSGFSPEEVWELLKYLSESAPAIPEPLQEELLKLLRTPDHKIRRTLYRIIGRGGLQFNGLILAEQLDWESDPVAKSLLIDAIASLGLKEVLPLLKHHLAQTPSPEGSEPSAIAVVRGSLKNAVAALTSPPRFRAHS